jgi:uncharacterized protein YecE (DUF72 family)
MKIHIGTSGYNYPEWRGTFYPEKFSTTKMFAYYAERFRTVEINATFYRMPTAKLTDGWRAQAPEGFQYALKAPQRITHFARLKDCEESLHMFCENARLLGPCLGTLLFQLPPNFKCDMARFTTFLGWLPPDIRSAFEFRHDSWLNEDVYSALATRQVALAIADFGDKTTPMKMTARHGYFRLRDEGYQTADLERWAEAVAARAAEWDDAFVYFKHEEEGKGPEFAKAFADILMSRGVSLA